MSRSYKKNPVVTCCKNPTGKREANKKVRRSKNVPNGRGFKKLFCSWNICDFKSIFWSMRKNSRNDEWEDIDKWKRK